MTRKPLRAEHASILGKLFNFNAKQEDQANPITLNLILLGENGVGKSTNLSKFIFGNCSHVETTIKIVERQKRVNVKGISVLAKVWDTAGEKKYEGMIGNFIDSCQFPKICVIFYDVGNPQSFKNVESFTSIWKKNQSKQCCEKSLVLIANKTELEVADLRLVSAKQGMELAKKHEALYVECSSFTDVDEVYEDIIEFKLRQLGLILEDVSEDEQKKQKIIRILKELNKQETEGKAMLLESRQFATLAIKQIYPFIAKANQFNIAHFAQICAEIVFLSSTIFQLANATQTLQFAQRFSQQSLKNQQQSQPIAQPMKLDIQPSQQTTPSPLQMEVIKNNEQKEMKNKQSLFKEALRSFQQGQQILESLPIFLKQKCSNISQYISSLSNSISSSDSRHLLPVHQQQNISNAKTAILEQKQHKQLDEARLLTKKVMQGLNKSLSKANSIISEISSFNRRIITSIINAKNTVNKSYHPISIGQNFQFLIAILISNYSSQTQSFYMPQQSKAKVTENLLKRIHENVCGAVKDLEQCSKQLQVLVNQCPKSKEELELELKIIAHNEGITYDSWKSQQNLYMEQMGSKIRKH